MIRSLSIKNYALIQALEMTPSPNLNIITGETGAGKSIMLGAVGLLLGNRADTKALFSDDEKCIIEGVFDIGGYQLQSLFDEADLDFDQECIIRREISPSGKSRAFVNDTPVTLDILKKLGVHLMDIHSQHETLHLGSNLYQLEILDIFSGHQNLLADYKKAYRTYKQAEKHFQELTQKASNSAQDADYKQFLFDELQSADLEADEQSQLEDELKLLEHAEEIKVNLGQLTQALDESEYSVINQLKESLPLLSAIKGFSENLESLHLRLDSALIEIEDVAREITMEQDRVELDPERLQLIKDRLDLLFRLQQKHQAADTSDLISLRDRLGQELAQVLNIDEEIAKAETQLSEAEKNARALAQKLSTSRKKHADSFANAIKSLIKKLGIENGEINITISPADLAPTGGDLVEFLFSANKGVAPREIKHVASGGEFSRLIFAIKYLLADKTAMPTIIFDEIDTGVSGEIALQMVNMMKQMAANHQVISISHLPQFAAGGDAHYFVYKDHSSDKSVSRIKKLHNDERVMAIAQMIGGEKPGESALQSARELLGTT
ncbi:DNA repair protein RecN [Marinoscillum furvescens]|uniref:DNA repair protein RecN n=1 Tax=Marinoscillum furvescens DSM 4134 TaxID=1122208 RepID=A0A3D9KX84_MARFU|nr:DNA repair protein RecN [Marinoscillum furvescens]RED93380.1 DNA replication and repair protein RecN [Marinoscillum furvescens DSM 4134]